MIKLGLLIGSELCVSPSLFILIRGLLGKCYLEGLDVLVLCDISGAKLVQSRSHAWVVNV